MPDRRRHRGPHPEDERLFDRSRWPDLRAAVDHLSWLLTRDYAVDSSLKLVGDRYQLEARQRLAVRRSACPDGALDRRAATLVNVDALTGGILDIDAFNLLTTIEAAQASGVLLRCRDGCIRDMASVHGSYRKVEETIPALQIIGRYLHQVGVASCTWWLDRPVSNSGRVGRLMQDIAEEQNWTWSTRLVADPDRELPSSGNVVVTADSVILDTCRCWSNLAAEIVSGCCPGARVVPMC